MSGLAADESTERCLLHITTRGATFWLAHLEAIIGTTPHGCLHVRPHRARTIESGTLLHALRSTKDGSVSYAIEGAQPRGETITSIFRVSPTTGSATTIDLPRRLRCLVLERLVPALATTSTNSATASPKKLCQDRLRRGRADM